MKLIEKVCLFVMLAVFISCSDDKDDIVEQQMEENSNYYALTVGNSWTYDLYRSVSIQGEEFEQKDYQLTTTITGTEEINGEEYFVFTNTSQGEFDCSFCESEVGDEKVRDSLGYLINSNGKILFSNESINPYLISSEDFGDIYGELTQDTISETPAGDFLDVKINKRYAVLTNGTTSNGEDRLVYGANSGLVVREFSLVSSGAIFAVLTLKESMLIENN